MENKTLLELLVPKLMTARNEASDLYNEAEKNRKESNYTDIDALEQSCYNDGVINALTTVLALLGIKD